MDQATTKVELGRRILSYLSTSSWLLIIILYYNNARLNSKKYHDFGGTHVGVLISLVPPRVHSDEEISGGQFVQAGHHQREDNPRIQGSTFGGEQ